MEKLLTLSQVCDLLQVSPALVYKWVHYGFMPYIKIGRLLRFKESELNIWLNKRLRKERSAYKVKLLVKLLDASLEVKPVV